MAARGRSVVATGLGCLRFSRGESEGGRSRAPLSQAISPATTGRVSGLEVPIRVLVPEMRQVFIRLRSGEVPPPRACDFIIESPSTRSRPALRRGGTIMASFGHRPRPSSLIIRGGAGGVAQSEVSATRRAETA